MNKPTFPQLLFFSIAVIAGAWLLVTGRSPPLGIVLLGLSHLALLFRHEQKQYWTATLTKSEVVRRLVRPIVVLVALIAGNFITSGRGFAPSVAVSSWLTVLGRLLVGVALVLVLGRTWMTWYRSSRPEVPPQSTG